MKKKSKIIKIVTGFGDLQQIAKDLFPDTDPKIMDWVLTHEQLKVQNVKKSYEELDGSEVWITSSEIVLYSILTQACVHMTHDTLEIYYSNVGGGITKHRPDRFGELEEYPYGLFDSLFYAIKEKLQIEKHPINNL